MGFQKSEHIYYDKYIPFEELNNFVEPLKMNINIPMDEFHSFIQNRIWEIELEQYLKKIYRDLLSTMPEIRRVVDVDKIVSMTYNTHTSGYDFRINPIDVINNILKELEINYSVEFIDLDGPFGIEYLKERFKEASKRLKKTYVDKEKEIDCIKDNLNNICNLYNIKLDDKLEKMCIPKTLLYYLAYKALKMYIETDNETYLIYAREYYYNVSHMKTSQYPHTIKIKNLNLWYESFIKEYEQVKENAGTFILKEHQLSEGIQCAGVEILRPGKIDREFRDVLARAKANPTIDDHEKWEELFRMKINYYMSSGYKKCISGIYGLTGYTGFSYRNDYIIFDKFYNDDKTNLGIKNLLTHEEAIYTFPADRFVLVKETKQTINKEKQKDHRIVKINHTINGSFRSKLGDIIYGRNLSNKTTDEAIEEAKKYMLIKEV